MIQNEKNIYIYETETKPNRISLLVLGACLFIVAFCLIFNELGVFRVGNREMRVGAGFPILITSVTVIAILANRKLLSHPLTKYWLLTVSVLYTASVTILMTFHTSIMILFPMFMAMLYRSKKLGVMALTGSLLCAVFSPVVGYLLGAWDVDLFRELILIATNGTAVIEGAAPGITALSVGKILLYISLPHLMMAGACAVLMFYVIRLGETHVLNQLRLNRLSRRDSLTGLYNQRVYNELLAEEQADTPVGILFFDVNGLKSVNDTFGHERGDLLLKRCAKSITDICAGEGEYGFRLGGDEFLLLLENATERDIMLKMEQWKAALARVNEENKASYNGLICSMAMGYSLGTMKELQASVKKADEGMYKNKSALKAEKTNQ